MSALDELLAITRSPGFEERGRMKLVAAFRDQSRLRLHFDLEDGSDSVSRWELAFDDVLEMHLTVADQCGLNVWSEDHPAIDQYTAAQETLAFSHRADDPDRILGQLWTAHRTAADDWIPFDRYFNAEMSLPELLRQKSGVLATGPEFLIAAYAEVLERNGCRPSTTKHTGSARANRAVMVHFDESYVIAKAVTATQLDGNDGVRIQS